MGKKVAQLAKEKQARDKAKAAFGQQLGEVRTQLSPTALVERATNHATDLAYRAADTVKAHKGVAIGGIAAVVLSTLIGRRFVRRRRADRMAIEETAKLTDAGIDAAQADKHDLDNNDPSASA